MSQPTVIVQLSNPTVTASAAGAPGPQGPAGSGGSTLARATVKTGAYTAAAGDLVPVDTTSAPVTITLPSAPADKTQVAVVLVTQGGSNTVTVACAGSDVLSKTGGPTTLTLALGQLAWLEYAAVGGIWTPLAGPQSPTGAAGGDLTGSYPSPALAATANVEAIIRANRLDQFAAPAAAVSLGGQKLTSLANGTLSSDAAAFGQIPTALPPSGTATGDLGGTYPAPTVTATHLAVPLPINQGGTGQAGAQAAINALTGAQSAGKYLRSDGVNASLAPIAAGDVPTLNQSTTGTAGNVTGVVALANGGTGATSAATALANLGAVTSSICDMYGLGLCTVDRLTDSGYSSAQSQGDLVLFLVNAPKTVSVSTLGIQVTVGGVTGSGTNAMALYTEAGVLIDQTGDMTTAMSSVQFAEGALGSSHSVAAGTNYFLAVLTHFSAGAPRFAATGTTQSSNIPVLNGHYTAIFKSAQSVFPASFTPGSYTLNSGNYVAYAR